MKRFLFLICFLSLCDSPASTSESIPEMRLQAEAGDTETQYQLALRLTNRPTAFQKLDEARSWHEKASAAGHSKATTALALFLLEGLGGPVDETRGLELLQNSAKKGEPLALLNLGNLHERGRLVEQDHHKAAALYESSARAGSIEAKVRLGEFYYHSPNDESPDYDRAFPLFLEAAEAGNADAQNYLGVMYEFGQGVQPDRVLARQYYEKAAWKNHAKAQGNLGNLLRFAPAGESDLLEAYRWYSFGAQKNDPNSMMGLAVLKQSLTPEQRAEAEAGLWKMQNRIDGRDSSKDSTEK